MAGLKYVANFDRFGMADVEQVGGKNASLGEMISRLSQAGIRVSICSAELFSTTGRSSARFPPNDVPQVPTRLGPR